MAVDQLLLSASIWVHGNYVTRLKNPGLSYDHIAGVPIVREHEQDPGELQMVSELPVPEGGWGSPEQLAALWKLALKRETKLADAGAGHRKLSPELRANYAHLDIATLAQGADISGASDAELRRGPRQGGRAKEMLTALTGRRWATANGRALQLSAAGSGRYQVQTVDNKPQRGRTDASIS